MGDLENDVDDTHEDINRETRRTRYALSQTNNCWWYLVIAILFVLMIVLVSVGN